MMTETERTPEQNHDEALRELRDYVKEMRRHAKKAHDAASDALHELEGVLKGLPGTDEAVDKASEEDLLSAVANTVHPTYRRYADAMDDLGSDLKRAVDKHLRGAAEADSLRSYLSAGDFSE